MDTSVGGDAALSATAGTGACADAVQGAQRSEFVGPGGGDVHGERRGEGVAGLRGGGCVGCDDGPGIDRTGVQG